MEWNGSKIDETGDTLNAHGCKEHQEQYLSETLILEIETIERDGECESEGVKECYKAYSKISTAFAVIFRDI